MNPSEVVDEIRQYTNNGYGVKMDDVLIAQSVIYDVVGFILGVLVVLIVVGMSIITALDICYITIPMFQDTVVHKRWDGSTDPNARVRFISHDARIAVNAAATQETGKSALSIYLGRRIKTYCIAAVVLYIAIAGSSVIVPLISKIVTGILTAFSTAFNL